MMNTPELLNSVTAEIAITDEDRARGFTELEVQMKDGTRKDFRVHAIARKEFVHAAAFEPAAATIYLVSRSLRETPEFVNRNIHPFGLMAVAGALACLIAGDSEGKAMIESSARRAICGKEENGNG